MKSPGTERLDVSGRALSLEGWERLGVTGGWRANVPRDDWRENTGRNKDSCPS